jgi:hypothetical protein
MTITAANIPTTLQNDFFDIPKIKGLDFLSANPAPSGAAAATVGAFRSSKNNMSTIS